MRGGQRTVWADRTDKVELALRTRFEPIEVEADFRMNWDAYSQLPGDLIDAVSFMDAVDRGVSIGLSPSTDRAVIAGLFLTLTTEIRISI